MEYESRSIEKLTSLQSSEVYHYLHKLTKGSVIPSSVFLDSSTVCTDEDTAFLCNHVVVNSLYYLLH